MEVDIGGRHIPMGDIILMRRHTAERIGEQPTTIPPRELMAGRRLPMALTDRRHAGQLITRIPVTPHAAPRCQHLTAAEVQHRPITPIREPMLRPDKAPARRPNAAAPMCRVGTKPLPSAITPPLLDQ